MRALERRIDELETRRNRKDYKTPYSAVVSLDGSVTVSHSKEGEFSLPDEAALDKWIEEEELGEFDCIRVVVVNANNTQGAEPKEL